MFSSEMVLVFAAVDLPCFQTLRPQLLSASCSLFCLSLEAHRRGPCANCLPSSSTFFPASISYFHFSWNSYSAERERQAHLERLVEAQQASKEGSAHLILFVGQFSHAKMCTTEHPTACTL